MGRLDFLYSQKALKKFQEPDRIDQYPKRIAIKWYAILIVVAFSILTVVGIVYFYITFNETFPFLQEYTENFETVFNFKDLLF